MTRSGMTIAKVSRHVVVAAALALLTGIALSVIFKPAAQRASPPDEIASLTPQGGSTPFPASNAPLRDAPPLPDSSRFDVVAPAEHDEPDAAASRESTEEPVERDDFNYATHLQSEESYAQQVALFEQAIADGTGAAPGDLLDLEAKDEVTPESAEQRRNEQSYLEYTFLYDQASEAGAPLLTSTPPLDVLANPHDQDLYQEQQEAESRYAERVDASAVDPLFYAQSMEQEEVDSGAPDFSNRSDDPADAPDAELPSGNY